MSTVLVTDSVTVDQFKASAKFAKRWGVPEGAEILFAKHENGNRLAATDGSAEELAKRVASDGKTSKQARASKPSNGKVRKAGTVKAPSGGSQVYITDDVMREVIQSLRNEVALAVQGLVRADEVGEIVSKAIRQHFAPNGNGAKAVAVADEVLPESLPVCGRHTKTVAKRLLDDGAAYGSLVKVTLPKSVKCYVDQCETSTTNAVRTDVTGSDAETVEEPEEAPVKTASAADLLA